MASSTAHKSLIHFFTERTEVAQPTRYFKRWSRRLRDYGFTREDAAVLALATFSTDEAGSILGMHSVITEDQAMINNWTNRREGILSHLVSMCQNLPSPYHRAALPELQRPETIFNASDDWRES